MTALFIIAQNLKKMSFNQEVGFTECNIYNMGCYSPIQKDQCTEMADKMHFREIVICQET